jgi:predicted nucleic acid-binding protein
LFSCLVSKNSAIRETIFSSQELKFYTCKFCIVELFKHKNKLLKCSALSEDELLEVFYQLLKSIHIYDENTITPDNWKQAIDLCSGVDEKDSVFIALSLQLKAKLWTGDVKLIKGLTLKGFIDFYQHPSKN